MVKDWWLTFVTYVEQHVQTLTTRTIEVYDACKMTIAPHVAKVREMTDPYFLVISLLLNFSCYRIICIIRLQWHKLSF